MWCILHSAYKTNRILLIVNYLRSHTCQPSPCQQWFDSGEFQFRYHAKLGKHHAQEHGELKMWGGISGKLSPAFPWMCYGAGNHHKHSWLCAQSHEWESLHFLRSPMLQWVTTQEWTWHTEIHRKLCVSLSSQFQGVLNICLKDFSLLNAMGALFFRFVLMVNTARVLKNCWWCNTKFLIHPVCS